MAQAPLTRHVHLSKPVANYVSLHTDGIRSSTASSSSSRQREVFRIALASAAFINTYQNTKIFGRRGGGHKQAVCLRSTKNEPITTASFVVDNSQLLASADGLTYRLSKDDDDLDEKNIAPWGSIVIGVDEGDGWLRVGGRYLPIEINGAPVLRPSTAGYDNFDDDVFDRFLRPRIDDTSHLAEDLLVSGILAPALAVFLVVLTGKYVPAWLLYEGVRKRAVLIPTLIHGVGLSLCWLAGSLAARAYEAESIDPNYPQETLVRTLKAIAFSTGLLVFLTGKLMLLEIAASILGFNIRQNQF